MEFKKNIVLTPSESNAVQKAVLSYVKQNNTYSFDFKGINFLPKNRILGVYINNKLYKYDLIGRTLHFDLPLSNVDNVSVVVLDRQNMLKPFLWGSQTITDNDFLLNKVIEEINIKTINETIPHNEEVNEENFVKNQKTFSLSDNLVDNNPLSNFIENENNVSSFQENLQNLERETTLKNENDELENLLDDYQETIDAPIEENFQDELPNFYSKIASQVEKMLNNNETEKILEEIIPDSKFVHIPKANGESYIFGVIYENNIPKYICYGERGKFSEERPEHLKMYYQWLPIDVDDVSGEGYYMMYQDAISGKNLEMTVI